MVVTGAKFCLKCTDPGTAQRRKIHTTEVVPSLGLVCYRITRIPGEDGFADVVKADFEFGEGPPVMVLGHLDTVHLVGTTDDELLRKSLPTMSEKDQHNLSLQLEPIQRWDFYDAVASRDHVLTIQTGDQALWANLLLTIGVRQAGE